MKRVLITGMSGTGKSTVIAALAARGYRAVDADTDEWSHWVDTGSGDAEAAGAAEPDPVWGNRDWVWREDRVARLLSTEDEGGDDPSVLFLSGCAINQGKFYARLDHVILLSAPAEVIMQRLATRTTNTYGKSPEEVQRVLGHIQSVEPLLRRRATLEIDTSAPVDDVVESIVRHVRPS